MQLQGRCAPSARVGTLRTRSVRVQASVGTQATSNAAYNKLKGIKVIRSSDGQAMDLPSLWGPQLAIQLRREVKPQLDAAGVKLFLVSIGTHARSKEFVEVTGFPAENLFVDPENETYTALGLNKGVGLTFFDWNTPLSIKKRMDNNKLGDLKDILSRWQPWIPPKQDQAFNQGGVYVFEGPNLLFSHKDPSTGAHADLQQVLGVSLKNLASANGCETECSI